MLTARGGVLDRILTFRSSAADTVHAHLTNVVDAINRRCPA
jgi:hypothetical protein